MFKSNSGCVQTFYNSMRKRTRFILFGFRQYTCILVLLTLLIIASNLGVLFDSNMKKILHNQVNKTVSIALLHLSNIINNKKIF